MLNRAVVVFVLLSGAAPIQAERMPLGPNPTIGGVRVSCLGIPTWVDDQIQGIAISVPDAIVLHPQLGNWPPVVQAFVYLHECAHRLPTIGSDEHAADCWAIQLGRNEGWINSDSLLVIQSYFANNPGSWAHLPGPLRVQQMQGCFMLTAPEIYHPSNSPAELGEENQEGGKMDLQSRKVDYNRLLGQAVYSHLEGKDISNDAKALIDQLVREGAERLISDGPSEAQLNQALRNAKVLADKIGEEHGHVESYKIKNAKRSLCPIYPFCRDSQ